MSRSGLAALFLAVLAAGSAALITMVALLVQFHGAVAKPEIWRSLIVSLSGAGAALCVIAVVHLSFVATRLAAGSRREKAKGQWMQVWSAVAAGAKGPAVAPANQEIASEGAAVLLQELTGHGAQRIRDALTAAGVIATDLAVARRGLAAQQPAAIAALERLAWIAPPEALPLFERAATSGIRSSRAALLGAMRLFASRPRSQAVGRTIVALVENHVAAAKEPMGARPFLAAVLLAAGDHLDWLCGALLTGSGHEVVRMAAIDAICRSHRPEAGERAGDMLLEVVEGETKAAALKGLAHLGHVPLSAARAVVAATDDPSSAVRVNAAHALAGVGADLALPALWRCLSDPAWEVRLAASDTLSNYGNSGLELLQRAADSHYDRFARDISLMALGTATTSSAVAGPVLPSVGRDQVVPNSP